MKGSDQFKEVIKAHLDERAASDLLFAKVYSKENKSIDKCIQYILGEVQKSGRNGFTDDEIFGMAVHYYDEDDLSISKNSISTVVVNTPIQTDAPKTKKPKAQKQIATAPIVQGSLF